MNSAITYSDRASFERKRLQLLQENGFRYEEIKLAKHNEKLKLFHDRKHFLIKQQFEHNKQRMQQKNDRDNEMYIHKYNMLQKQLEQEDSKRNNPLEHINKRIKVLNPNESKSYRQLIRSWFNYYQPTV